MTTASSPVASLDAERAADHRVPVTVLTGFLGSGKTTLLNYILTAQHGKKIAVIENEFGEIGIDNDLVINADEEIFEMNNGCICCTVRGDLIRILGSLMRRRDRFDAILIETTGLADPAPVAQTFFVDDEMQGKLKLDGIVTMVDAKHVLLHIEDSSECQEQLAFADVVILNKCDLVSPADLDDLQRRIRGMNAVARIIRATNAEVPLDDVLNIGGFDLDRALATRPTFLEPEYPFEWGGTFDFAPGNVQLVLADGPDPEMTLMAWKLPNTTADALAAAQDRVAVHFSDDPVPVQPGQGFELRLTPTELCLDGAGEKRFLLHVEHAGAYALFTQHHPDEFQMRVEQQTQRLLPVAEHHYNPEHEHDEEVTSVGLEFSGDFDQQKLNRWLGDLLMNKGTDIFRMKGIVAIRGEPLRFVFQGVHMLFDGRPDRPWGDTARSSQLVFIGRHLDRQALHDGFRACLAS
ncbi:MAG: GTP-binding protein [Gemmatimonas sp.]|uniref:CobW family GTP-binding protein n=1 Tax=Gemmatimonas sp. TaxID=1962908 RepID=UPI0031C6EEE9|nr:GTP-binding protein [Gemmatimonas sp.]